MSTLLLWLEGPLQSWGVDSHFGNRATLPFPTRSGITGLLCCAAGRGGEQVEWLARMAQCPLTVIAYAREKERAPQLHDFHMVGSGYDSADKWQDLHILKKADGKKQVGPGTKMTVRSYLQDMAFACALTLPDDEAQKLDAALKAPVWEMSLGRKNCVPSDMIGRGLFADEDAALQAAADIARKKERRQLFRVLEGEHEGDRMYLNDVPVRFGIHKSYRDRLVSIVEA